MANEKQLLIEALKKSHDVRFTPGVYEHSIYGKAALLLEKSEEVVRCKDCKHWRTDENSSIPELGNCDIEEADFTLWRWDCDFCSYGERKDND